MSVSLSIIVPVYNAGASLQRLTRSIQSQSFTDYEVILVDDGSTDSSLAVCERIAGQDSRFTVIRSFNQGAGPARNLGVGKATGAWAYFPDADDELYDERFLENLMARADSTDSDLLVFGYIVRNSSGRMIKSFSYPELLLDGDEVRSHYERHIAMDCDLAIQGAPWNKLFKMSLIRDFAITYPPLRRHQDEGFISRYMQVAGSVEFLGLTGYIYYANDSQGVNRKYPVDYVESVKGLYYIRKETILSWNPDNKAVSGLVAKELFCNMIHAFELSFHGKYSLKRKDRMDWMRRHLSEVDYKHLDASMIRKRPYHGMIFMLLPVSLTLSYHIIELKYRIQLMLS